MILDFEGVKYQVKFRHFEYAPLMILPGSMAWVSHISSCDIHGENDLAYGDALCSISDIFSRRKGRQISLGRALKSLGWPQEKRKRFIKAVREQELRAGKKRETHAV